MPTIYIYPDGTSSTARPRDGQKFDHHSSDKISHYTWDGMYEEWCYNGVTLYADLASGLVPPATRAEELKCECGTEIAGSNKHSNWCKKYNADA